MERRGENEFREARYPTGIQSFEVIREGNKVYVDKTALLYRLAATGSYYFLSRPRRFGKSLMLSTLKAYFEGRRELFEGLAVASLEKEWKRYPVINLTMGGKDFSSIDSLKSHLNKVLEENENILGVEAGSEYPDDRFYTLIRNAVRKHGERVVILIDEYDKPLLDTRYRQNQLHGDVKNLMRGFYGCIKESADYIRFVMIAGITKFAHVNIFSGLNNLTDISLEPTYNALCGISESEMAEYFSQDMLEFAAAQGLTEEEASHEFKLHYDGYRFAASGENIYNPYSTLCAFRKQEFGNYWFTSGTSYHLVESLKQNQYNFSKIEGIRLTADQIMQEPSASVSPNALLYQAGYLTIKDYRSGLYTLGLPNKEVTSGFYNDLLKLLVPAADTDFNAMLLSAYAQEGEPEKIMEMLQIGLSHFNNMEMKKPEYEYHFKVILHAVLMAAALDVEGEVLTPAGRIDMVVCTKRFIYLFEFKLDSTPEEALSQIEEKDYPFKYYGDTRKIFKIGASFSTALRRLTSWVIV